MDYHHYVVRQTVVVTHPSGHKETKVRVEQYETGPVHKLPVYGGWRYRNIERS